MYEYGMQGDSVSCLHLLQLHLLGHHSIFFFGLGNLPLTGCSCIHCGRWAS